MEVKFRTMGDFSFSGKKVLLRVDLNSSIINGKVELSERIKAHAGTILELCKQRAMVIVLAHQGRPGGKDFISLKQHATMLNRFVKIKFVPDIMGKKAVNKIENMKPGDALLLENVRFIKEEFAQVKGNRFIKIIAPLCDMFMLDAFSIAHRDQASITGFTKVIPSCMGPVMERELNNINKLVKKIKKPYIICLGGLKFKDYFGFMESSLKGSASKILASGALGQLFLMVKGVSLGETESFLLQLGLLKLLPKAKQILRKYRTKIEVPVDVAIEYGRKRLDIPVKQLPSKYMIYDIGRETANRYANIIEKSKTIFMKGPPGAYEKKGFGAGTKKLLSAVALSSGFSLLGGGDSTTALDYFKINKNKISYISLSGGAMLLYMAGEKLPGLEALQEPNHKSNSG